MIPILVKVGAVGVVAWLALKKKPAGDNSTPSSPPSGLPQAPQGAGGKEPVIGQRWILWGVDLVSIVSETDDRYEGFYSSESGQLVAVVDGRTFDASRTSAVVVSPSLAPDLPANWN